MIKVKMLVQSTYNGQLLREGKIYEVPEETAERWQVSKIAEIIQEEEE
ncbi:hypothetical protein [Gracilibacillus xinjiangensis]|uniref:Phage protein n=1 Tax=Gracilibacillus xinjiangensis TaxID=1193282 RepID=A0ABV8WXW3_9BACI